MAVGSKILIYSNDAIESEKLIRLLMYQKFVPKAVESIAYASMALVSREYPIFLCTYSAEDNAILDYLAFMRQDDKMRSVIPVVMLDKPTPECITDLIKIGCTNFILKNAEQQIFIDKIESIAESIGDYRDKRQFARIEIPEYENAQLLITARNGNKYPVRVRNISMGGLQLTWSPEKMPVQKMVAGDVLVNSLLIAKNLDLYADLKIISVFNYRAGVQFMGLNEERQSKLCHFIYERLLAEKIVN
ncbi:MAG: PilZ domain-containing protein [Candidatus Fibromonas sp.]|jgi:DNA-binding NarL/FixJ family response regulator|nr:PilZ domain-containing protein [Candidatus Fibromonas sp.]